MHDARQQELQQQKSSLYDARWRRATAAYLDANPWCKAHLDRGEYVRSAVTDHVKPHRGNLRLFWDRSNWQPLCKADHDSKTAREDSSFAYGY